MAFWASPWQLSTVSREGIGAKARFDPEKCQKERFAPLPAVLFIRRVSCPPSLWRSGGVAGLPTVFLEGLLTKLSRMKT